MRITVDEAREYFAHPSQQLYGVTPENLPGEPFEYWAKGGICGVFHPAPATGVWMVHFAAMPSEWGRLVEPSREVLRAFWDEKKPQRIVGWTPASLRAAVALSRRVGFVEDGRLPLPDGEIIMSGWRA